MFQHEGIDGLAVDVLAILAPLAQNLEGPMFFGKTCSVLLPSVFMA